MSVSDVSIYLDLVLIYRTSCFSVWYFQKVPLHFIFSNSKLSSWLLTGLKAMRGKARFNCWDEKFPNAQKSQMICPQPHGLLGQSSVLSSFWLDRSHLFYEKIILFTVQVMICREARQEAGRSVRRQLK